MTIFLLAVIAIGVLLLSDAGKQLLGSLMSMAIFGIVIFLVWLGFTIYGPAVWEWTEPMLPTVAALGILIFAWVKVQKIKETDDKHLSEFSKTIKHTESSVLLVAFIALYLAIGWALSFLGSAS